MPTRLSLEAPTALEYFASLVADDQSLSVLEAAVAVAQDEMPELDPQAVIDEVDGLADRLRRRIAADAAPMQRVRLLNYYFFRELGFAGNVNHYDDRSNSYLPEVLRTRRGIPITLALLYVELATQIGLHAAGVAFPGHFLVTVQVPSGARHGEIVIDPFSGRSLSREDLLEWLQPYWQHYRLSGDNEMPLGPFLRRASPREVIARLLRNLKDIHRSADDWPRLVAVMHRLVILLPQDWSERRDRALAFAGLGRPDLAAEDLAVYLAHEPAAEDAQAMGELLATWRLQPGARWQ